MNKTQDARADLQARIFRNSLPFRMTVKEVIRALKLKPGERCLNIGDEGGLFGYHLRKLGGTWATVVSGDEQLDLAGELIESDLHALDNTGRLPFADKTFDAVVIINSLETIRNDEDFIEECHRVIKNEGRLIVNVANRKAATLINGLRHLVGLSPEKGGMARAGYTEPEMFRILKNGFDVSNMRTYMRFFVVLVDTFVRAATRNQPTAEGLGRTARCYSLAAPVYWLAFQLDLFLCMTRGFSLVCWAKRRAWLPRKTPVLSDGRRISEAVLSRAVD